MKVVLKLWIVLFALMQISMFFDNNHSDSASNSFSTRNLNDAFEQISISHIVANALPELKLLWSAGCLTGIAVTFLWLRLAETRARQNRLAKICGVILLMVGTYLVGTLLPMTVIGSFAEVPWQVQQMIPSVKASSDLFSAFKIAASGIALLIGSYAFCFGKKVEGLQA